MYFKGRTVFGPVCSVVKSVKKLNISKPMRTMPTSDDLRLYDITYETYVEVVSLKK